MEKLFSNPVPTQTFDCPPPLSLAELVALARPPPRPLRIFSIDPGTKNLGWALLENRQLVRSGVVDLGMQAPHVCGEGLKKQVARRTVEWWKTIDLATFDVVVLENQYASSFATTFIPGLVETTLWGLFLSRDKPVEVVSSSAVKAHFQFSGAGHDANKREAQARFGHLLPPDAQGRVHDVLDAILNAYYWLDKQKV